MLDTILMAGLLALQGGGPHADECRYEGERAANVDAAGVELLRMDVGAGSLRVEGRAGVGEVTVRGRACASSPELLDRLRVTARKDGSEVIVATEPLDNDFRDAEYARLDLTLVVPEHMAAAIADGSGDAYLSGLGVLTVNDGSGELEVHDIAGDTHIEDGSGELSISGINGSLDIDDGSGDVDVKQVTGNVTLADASGGVDLADAGAGVHITRDGSGSISVNGVRGDFIVDRDGSGGISYSNVTGRVDVPERERHRRRR